MIENKFGWHTATDQEYDLWYKTHQMPTSDLDSIGQKFNCDKANRQILSKFWKNGDTDEGIIAAGHNYTQIYDTYFSGMRYNKINILEFGVGNYPTNGHSLRMWLEYFPFANITFLDWSDTNFIFDFEFDRSRVDFVLCDQSDNKAMSDFASQNYHKYDVVIDDCAHIGKFQYDTLKIFFPSLLNNEGLYFIEDLHDNSFLQYIPTLYDSLNRNNVLYNESGLEYIPGIAKIDLYRSLICLHKGNKISR